MRWLMTAQSELDSSTGDHIPKTILAPIHLSLQGKQKLYAIIHGLLYVMYDHTICFFIYTSLYIYIYIHVLLQATVDGSELWHWICLKFPFRLVKFCFGRGADTRVSAPPLPLAETDPFRLWKTRWWTRVSYFQLFSRVSTSWRELEVTLPCRYIYVNILYIYIYRHISSFTNTLSNCIFF